MSCRPSPGPDGARSKWSREAAPADPGRCGPSPPQAQAPLLESPSVKVRSRSCSASSASRR
eukprot:15289786-Alexandrium_andersonii.AAC.1